MQCRMTATAVSRTHWAAPTRRRRLLAALVLALTVLGWSTTRLGVPVPHWPDVASFVGVGSVYTVADVERRLARDPMDWVGRTVLVRGQPDSYILAVPAGIVRHSPLPLRWLWQAPVSIVMRIGLVDPGRLNSPRPLALHWGDPDRLLTFLRRLPMAGRFAPRPQWLHWRMAAVYRIQLNGPPGSSSPGGDAVLLDAEPED